MDHPNIAKVFDGGMTDAGRPYFVMELVKGEPITDVLRPQPAPAAAAAGAVRAGLPRRPARAPEGDHPPRHQADQRAGGDARHDAGGEGDRLRRRQGAGAGADGEDAVHRLRPARRHAAVHVAGAGRAERAGRRHAQRHLLAGRAAVRAADRHDAVRQGAVPQGGPGRDPPDHPRGGAAAAQHAAERVEGVAAVDLRPAAHGAGEADEAGARGAGLDRDEGAGEGPQPPLRDGQRLRGGRASATCTTSRCRRARRRRPTGCRSSCGGTRRRWSTASVIGVVAVACWWGASAGRCATGRPGRRRWPGRSS